MADDSDQPIGVPLRILAVVLALMLAFFAGAIIAGASDNVSLPTCHDVSHGTAKPSANGDCFDGSSTRATTGMVAAILAGIAAAGAVIASIMLAATGRWGQLLMIVAGAAVVFILLEIAVIHI